MTQTIVNMQLESTVDLICPQFIIEPSNNTIGHGETLTMKGKLTDPQKSKL